jgi:AcrR family transcriptional regulator
VELIEERGFEALTVSELVERAMVSRAAFYRAYEDKYDLVEQIYEEQVQALRDTVASRITEHPPQTWVAFFEHVAAYERLYRALLGRNGSQWFVLKMRASMLALALEYRSRPIWQPETGHPLYPTTDDFIPDVFATMFVEAVTWWLEHGRPYPPAEMARRCIAMAMAVFGEASTWP